VVDRFVIAVGFHDVLDGKNHVDESLQVRAALRGHFFRAESRSLRAAANSFSANSHFERLLKGKMGDQEQHASLPEKQMRPIL
jgi:hypothetical protein